MFTETGLGGPVVRRTSGYISKYLQDHESCKVEISLIDEHEVISQLNTNKKLKDSFREHLSNKLHLYFLAPYYEKYNDLNNVPKAIKQEIVNKLSHWVIDVSNTDSIDLAINTGGGIDLKEVNPNTYESTIQPGLYFIGEILDLNARTNGFNITVCYATANKCIEAIKNKLSK